MFVCFTLVGPREAFESARTSDAFPRITVGLSSTSSKQDFNRKPEAPAATGSRTQGLPESEANLAASFIPDSQSGESVPTLMQRAWAWGVKSGISSTLWIMAGDAPADKSVLAMRSMETKLVMHWISGDSLRIAESWIHAFAAHPSGSAFPLSFPSMWF